jgi:hypothetical protein
MKQFPPDVDPASLSPSAEPENFPPHPGKIEIYHGSQLLEVEDASTVSDQRKFHYLRDSQGRYTGRIPVAKSVGHFFRADGSEAAPGEPAEKGFIVLIDPSGKEIITYHSAGSYH